MKSVTILVTTKNDERTIKKCVDSLLKQSYKNRKIYVTVATSSTDKTYDILKQYGKKIILERITGNRPASYNQMLKKVNTDYVAFTDGDAVCDKNWLDELISSFKPGVVAVGGMIKNPKSENKLQDLIGRELEYRFAHLPKEVSRLPTMNLCVITKYAKMEKFDESLRVAQETDWGYRLNKYGKTLFNPKAVVWHYHRATWKGYFKQQYLYGRYAPAVYSKKENRAKMLGDEVTTTTMVVELLLMLSAIAFMILSTIMWLLNLNAFTFVYKWSSTIFILLSFLSFELRTIKYKLITKPTDVFYYMIIFLIRSVAWSFGVIVWVFRR